MPSDWLLLIFLQNRKNAAQQSGKASNKISNRVVLSGTTLALLIGYLAWLHYGGK